MASWAAGQPHGLPPGPPNPVLSFPIPRPPRACDWSWTVWPALPSSPPSLRFPGGQARLSLCQQGLPFTGCWPGGHLSRTVGGGVEAVHPQAWPPQVPQQPRVERYIQDACCLFLLVNHSPFRLWVWCPTPTPTAPWPLWADTVPCGWRATTALFGQRGAYACFQSTSAQLHILKDGETVVCSSGQ